MQVILLEITFITCIMTLNKNLSPSPSLLYIGLPYNFISHSLVYLIGPIQKENTFTNSNFHVCDVFAAKRIHTVCDEAIVVKIMFDIQYYRLALYKEWRSKF